MSEVQSPLNITTSETIIQLLAKTNLAIQLVFVQMENNTIKVSHINLDEDTAEIIRKKCQNFINERKNWKAISYFEEPDNETTRGIVRTISIGEIPHNKDILKKSINLEPHINEKLMKSTKIMGFRFETSNNKSALFLKKSTKEYFVLKNNKPFALVTNGVAKIYDGSLVKFPVDFDIVKYSDDILIYKPFQFEEMFGFHEIYEKDRLEVFTHFRKKSDYEIEHLDIYESNIQSTKVQLRKFSTIKEKKIYMQKFSNIKTILKKRPIKTIIIKGKKIHFDDGSKGLINFYNDNHLDSQFTKKNYTAHSKTEE